MFFFRKKKKNIPQRIRELFSPLEKNYVKALILLDERGIELYSYVRGTFPLQKDLQGFLNMLSASEKVIKQIFNEQHLDKSNDFVSSIILKFGIYRFYLVSSKIFFILYVVDEHIKSPNTTTIEKTLMKKLKEIKEKEIIESYS